MGTPAEFQGKQERTRGNNHVSSHPLRGAERKSATTALAPLLLSWGAPVRILRSCSGGWPMCGCWRRPYILWLSSFQQVGLMPLSLPLCGLVTNRIQRKWHRILSLASVLPLRSQAAGCFPGATLLGTWQACGEKPRPCAIALGDTPLRAREWVMLLSIAVHDRNSVRGGKWESPAECCLHPHPKITAQEQRV